MKIFREDGHTFICKFVNTRNGFKHVCEVYNDAKEQKLFETKKTYLNRTWEAYEFESVLNKAKGMLQGD